MAGSPFVEDVNLLRGNGLLLLQQMADLTARIPAGPWLAWLDERNFLYFQPEPGAICGWIELLYWRSFGCGSSFLQEHRPLAWVDQLAPLEICWWYLADRLDRLHQKSWSLLDARAVRAIVVELVNAEEPVVGGLLQSLVDFSDFKERWWGASAAHSHAVHEVSALAERLRQRQRAWVSVGRRLVEDFLDWEAIGWPGIEVLGPIVRVAALELLEQNSGRW